jgi:hypothetical protein
LDAVTQEIGRRLVDDVWVTDVQAEGGGGGGGSTPGAAIVRGPFSFAFDTPNIENGVEVYTPAIGDVLLDVSVVTDVGFDGTTPMADVGTFIGQNYGYFGYANQAINSINVADQVFEGVQHGPIGTSLVVAQISGGGTIRFVSSPITTADPIMLVVSQDGTKGGDPVGGTAGSGRVYIVTATPVAF